MYNPFDYWSHRDQPNHREEMTAEHRQFLTEELHGVDCLVDFGPGNGRTFECYQGKTVLGWDITGQYTDHCLRKANKYNITYTAIIAPDPKILQGFKAEVAVFSYILLHEPDPTRYLSVAGQMTEKILIVDTVRRGKSAHCFLHKYDILAKQAELEIQNQQQKDAMYLGVFYAN